jgi:hypothetical protein
MSLRPWIRRRRRLPCTARPQVEVLETRQLLAATTWPGLLQPVAVTGAHETLDRAWTLGDLSNTPQAAAVGTLGSGPAGAADVNWYSFSLDTPARVVVTTPDQQVPGAATTVLGLYNNDPFDFTDPYDLIGHRLLVQDLSAPGHDARIERSLAAGTYYLAVSGSGNRYFHPFLSDSGNFGSTGPYGLLVTATDLGLDPTSNPVLLASDPAAGASLDRSPLILRLDFSAPLDQSTFFVGLNVRLTFNPQGTFGDANDRDVPLAGVNFTPVANDATLTSADELQIIPAVPLSPGSYQVFLGGNMNTNVLPLADLQGNPLGMDELHQAGQDMTLRFQVVGVEGNPTPGAGATDTAATARDLGDLTTAGLVQVPGAIGEDPTAKAGFKPANDVEMYHFRISRPGRYAFGAEVFAGRIGSPLDPGVSLFQMDPNGQLRLLAGNDNSQDATPSDNGAYTPLYTDSALYFNLGAGDYYVAVSSHGNVADPAADWLPGVGGIFDPLVSHSGTGGSSTGNYVLNLLVQPAGAPPQVVVGSLVPGSTLTAPPTQFTVQFSEPMNLQELAFQTYEQTGQGGIKPVYVMANDGNVYFPRWQSFDFTTDVATFLMLGALPNGGYELHLSGLHGLADLGGNTLLPNDPNGDYVIPFQVNALPRGTNGNPLLYTYQGSSDTGEYTQDLGILFPLELQAGVTVLRTPAVLANTPRLETTDAYTFQVLQDQDYLFILNGLNGANLPPGIQLILVDAAGNPVPTSLQADGNGLLAGLHAGSYALLLEGLPPDPAGTLGYQLQIALGGAADQAPALTSGPAPALRVRLVGTTPVEASAAPRRDTPGGPAPVNPRPPAAPLREDGVVQGLAALTSGPVGGVTAPALAEQTPQQMLVRGPDPAILTGLTELLVLTSTSGYGGEESAAAEQGLAGWPMLLANLIPSIAINPAKLAASIPACLDRLFDGAEQLDVRGVLAERSADLSPRTTPLPQRPLAAGWNVGQRPEMASTGMPPPSLAIQASAGASNTPETALAAGHSQHQPLPVAVASDTSPGARTFANRNIWLGAVLASVGGGFAVLKRYRRGRRQVRVSLPRSLGHQPLPETVVVGDGAR